jgi:hypothetical protein
MNAWDTDDGRKAIRAIGYVPLVNDQDMWDGAARRWLVGKKLSVLCFPAETVVSRTGPGTIAFDPDYSTALIKAVLAMAEDQK